MTVIETASSVYMGFGIILGVISAAECLSQPRPVYRRSWLVWWRDALICLVVVFPLTALFWPVYLFMRR